MTHLWPLFFPKWVLKTLTGLNFEYWPFETWPLDIIMRTAIDVWNPSYWVELFAWKIPGSPTLFWAKWASIKRSVSSEWKVNSCPASAKTKLSRGILSSLEKTVGCQSHLTKLANSKISLSGEQISRWNPRSNHQHNFRQLVCKNIYIKNPRAK